MASADFISPMAPAAPVTSITGPRIAVAGSSIASIPKLKGKNNYEEWCNAIQGYCQMNGKWRYMIGELSQPIEPAENKTKKIAQYVKDPAKWNGICDSLESAIRCTVSVDPMSHVHGLSNCSLMWKKFQTFHRNTGFLQRDAIFIWLSTKTLDDFQGIAEFANAIKKDATRLKEIGITDLPSWIYTTWLLHGLSSEYNGFKMMLNNNQRAIESEGEMKELDFDSVLEQLLSMSKDLPTRNDPRLLKTFAAKSKDKCKSSSNETCSYCSEPGHNERNC